MSSRVVTVFDVAKYILNRHGNTSTMKLQKLIYYAQAWSLVWDDKRLFREKIEAWINGPVVPKLYEAHRGKFEIGSRTITGDTSKLSRDQRETIDQVVEFYGNQNSQWLSDLTHSEWPWRKAREGLSDTERGGREISLDVMSEFYSSLPDDGAK